MNKQPSSTIMTRLCWGVFFLALLFLAFQVIPSVLGQQDASKRSAAKPKATVNLVAAGKQGGAPASVVDASQATQRKSTILESTNDAGRLPANTPKLPATPTSSCTPIVVNGSIDSGDPTQVDRLYRSGIPQTCPASTTCDIFGDSTPRHYDEYTFTNTTGATQCVTVDTNTGCGTNFIFTGAYLGSFDPNNICTNWIGDSGTSPPPDRPFQVDLDDGQALVVVVSEVAPEAGCSAYTVTITGLCAGETAGSFVIGDLDAVVGKKVTFWGTQWSKANSLSGGSAPSSFKGFANVLTPNPPVCGGTWKSDPGNSSRPPNTVPDYISVIAASSITKSGSVINGNSPRLVIVKTDPGYGPVPGHTGTGTVTAIICP